MGVHKKENTKKTNANNSNKNMKGSRKSKYGYKTKGGAMEVQKSIEPEQRAHVQIMKASKGCYEQGKQ